MNTLDSGGLPQTCCSNCRTVFEISRELLQSSDTRVRCGECLSIFDALSNLREDEGSPLHTDPVTGEIVQSEIHDRQSQPEAAPEPHQKVSGLSDAGAAALAGLTKATSPKDVTYSDFSLFAEDSNLPEVHYREPAAEAGKSSDESFPETVVEAQAELKNRETAGFPSAVALSKEVDFVTSESQHDQIVFRYRDREPPAEPVTGRKLSSEIDEMIERVRYGESRPPPAQPVDFEQNRWSRPALIIGGAMLCAVLALGFTAREGLLRNPAVNSAFKTVCSVLPCTAPMLVDIAAFRQLKRAAFSHPTINNALLIDFAFVNEASFSQPLPVLAVLMEDQSGSVVVKNDFSPSEYLSKWQEGYVLASGERLNVSLTVEDPGSEVTMFKVIFQ
ncbi:MAG: zinc-ribbon and DUF3426 domain-containing protein [Granulosicoccus sp.]